MINIGDTVRVKTVDELVEFCDDNDYEYSFNDGEFESEDFNACFVYEMTEHCGKEYKVVSQSGSGNFELQGNDGVEEWWFDEDMLVLVSEKEEEPMDTGREIVIHIDVDKQKIRALKWAGSEYKAVEGIYAKGEDPIAKAKELLDTIVYPSGFKIGDFVRANSEGNDTYCMTCGEWVGRITGIDDESLDVRTIHPANCVDDCGSNYRVYMDTMEIIPIEELHNYITHEDINNMEGFALDGYVITEKDAGIVYDYTLKAVKYKSVFNGEIKEANYAEARFFTKLHKELFLKKVNEITEKRLENL